MKRVVVAEVSEKDYPKLLPLISVPEIDGHCWNQGSIRKSGIVLLLKQAGIDSITEDHVEEVHISIDNTPDSISEYIVHFFENLQKQLYHPEMTGAILVLDFLPLYLSRTRLDKIVAKLFEGEFFRTAFSKIVFLLRNVDWLAKSRSFQYIQSSGTLIPEIWAVDLRGYVAASRQAGDGESNPISRDSFRLLLKTDSATIYKSLIYETNCYIGHFVLPYTHVRTHYYLTDYIRRDNVWEFMYRSLLDVISGSERALVIGVGFEHAAIAKVGEQLKASVEASPGDSFLHFIPAFDGNTPSDLVPEQWSQTFDLAVVVTDIVNTGGTVSPWIAKLKKTAQGRPVRMFSIAKMKNSPAQIDGVDVVAGVGIRRTYYRPEDCVLCSIHQPEARVSKADDFRVISPQQMTPYDFWEMIQETKALRVNERDPRGKLLLYRIDTAEITRRYGGWLVNLIKARYVDKFPRIQADFIVTVDEVWGQSFARLVGRALDVPSIVSIPRTHLERTSASGLPTETEAKPPFPRRSRVLLVDDGINNGETIRKLIYFCQAADADLLGSIVFINRLDAHGTARIERQMGNRSVFSLYSWPMVHA